MLECRALVALATGRALHCRALVDILEVLLTLLFTAELLLANEAEDIVILVARPRRILVRSKPVL